MHEFDQDLFTKTIVIYFMFVTPLLCWMSHRLIARASLRRIVVTEGHAKMAEAPFDIDIQTECLSLSMFRESRMRGSESFIKIWQKNVRVLADYNAWKALRQSWRTDEYEGIETEAV